jgi:hypothetical protein
LQTFASKAKNAIGGIMAPSEYRIVPNGIHPLLLGMNREQVTRVMGTEPEVRQSRITGEEALWFKDANARAVMREGRVVEIALAPPANVLFDGKPLFRDPSVWRSVVVEDSNAHECLGFIVLERFGLTLTGFHDDDPSQLAVTAFERGRWDAMRGKMQPFSG